MSKKNQSINAVPFQSDAGSEDSFEKVDETESVSEETEVLFSCNTECTSSSSGRQSDKKSTRGKRSSQDEMFNEIATFLKFNWTRDAKKATGQVIRFEKLQLQN